MFFFFSIFEPGFSRLQWQQVSDYFSRTSYLIKIEKFENVEYKKYYNFILLMNCFIFYCLILLRVDRTFSLIFHYFFVSVSSFVQKFTRAHTHMWVLYSLIFFVYTRRVQQVYIVDIYTHYMPCCFYL